MNHDLLKKAAIYYKDAGFALLPINNEKRPTIQSWTQFQNTKPNDEQINNWFDGSTSDTTGIAVLAGKVSGNVEIIDVDCKYDLSGNLMKDFCDILKEHLSDTFGRLLIARTVNKGFHIVYRVPADCVQGNKKLAQRPPTAEEAAEGKKLKDLIETRGNGGYIAVAPTNGYKWLQGTPKTVPLITAEEREMVLTVARSFDQMPMIEQASVEHKNFSQPSDVLSPFEDYNERADVPALLEKHGWKQSARSGDRIVFKRPGDTNNKFSANFHNRLKVFYVFTTSTAFTSGRGYNPVQVYTLLEHSGDLSAASRALYIEGYGARRSNSSQQNRNKHIERVPRRPQNSNFYKWFKEQQKEEKT